jgi:serine/threonine protein kinase
MSEGSLPSGGSAGRLGKYELLQELTSSGVATTFLARGQGVGEGHGKLAHILRLHRQATKNVQLLEDFVAGARRAAGLKHPNVVGVLEVGVGEGEVFVASEHVPGPTLSELVEGVGAEGLPLPILLKILSDALEGLGAAHALSPPLLHGELGPFSLIVGHDGVTRVAGLGVARPLARLGLHGVKGHERLSYAAPERVRAMATPTTDAGPITASADLYAMGVVLWEGIARRRLVGSRIETAVVQRVMAGHVPPPTVAPGAVPDIVLYALEQILDKDPSKRLADAAEVAALLQTVGASRIAADKDVAVLVRRVAASVTAAPAAQKPFVAIETHAKPPERETMPYGRSVLGEGRRPVAGVGGEAGKPLERGTLPFGNASSTLLGGLNASVARAALGLDAPAGAKPPQRAATVTSTLPKKAAIPAAPPPSDDEPEVTEDGSLKLDWSAPLAHLVAPKPAQRTPSVLPKSGSIAPSRGAPPKTTPPGESFEHKRSIAPTTPPEAPAAKPAAPPPAAKPAAPPSAANPAAPPPAAKPAAPPPAAKPAAPPPAAKPAAPPPAAKPAALPVVAEAPKRAIPDARPTPKGNPEAPSGRALSLEELVFADDEELAPPSQQQTARHQFVPTDRIQRAVEASLRLGSNVEAAPDSQDGIAHTQRVPSAEALAEIASAATDRLAPGDIIERYELLFERARRGAVATWAARLAGATGQVTALHVYGLPAREAGLRDLFAKCAAVAARATGAHVAELLDFGETDTLIYVVTEWLDGDTVEALQQAAGGPLPPPIALRIAADVCAALVSIHELGSDPHRGSPRTRRALPEERAGHARRRREAPGGRPVRPHRRARAARQPAARRFRLSRAGAGCGCSARSTHRRVRRGRAPAHVAHRRAAHVGQAATPGRGGTRGRSSRRSSARRCTARARAASRRCRSCARPSTRWPTQRATTRSRASFRRPWPRRSRSSRRT